MRCSQCGGGCWKPECAPLFQEDRRRLFRNAIDGTDKSYALGRQMPQSRAEMRALEKQRGVEFTTELSAVERTRVEYAKHLETGGERCMTAEQLNPVKSDNYSLVPKMLENLRKDNTIEVKS